MRPTVLPDWFPKPEPKSPLSEKEALLMRLRAVKGKGAGLGNISELLSLVADSLAYLVENTEEASKKLPKLPPDSKPEVELRR